MKRHVAVVGELGVGLAIGREEIAEFLGKFEEFATGFDWFFRHVFYFGGSLAWRNLELVIEDFGLGCKWLLVSGLGGCGYLEWVVTGKVRGPRASVWSAVE